MDEVLVAREIRCVAGTEAMQCGWMMQCEGHVKALADLAPGVCWISSWGYKVVSSLLD